jgi:hypothetical protein
MNVIENSQHRCSSRRNGNKQPTHSCECHPSLQLIFWHCAKGLPNLVFFGIQSNGLQSLQFPESLEWLFQKHQPKYLCTQRRKNSPVAPVPMIPTFFPSKPTGSLGHRAVWNASPLKSSTPGTLGKVGLLKTPIPVIRKRDVYVSPDSSVSFQMLASLSQCALFIRVLN